MQSSTAVPSITSSASNSSSQRPGKPLRTPACAGDLRQTVWHCRPDCHRHHESQPAADHHLGRGQLRSPLFAWRQGRANRVDLQPYWRGDRRTPERAQQRDLVFLWWREQ